MKKPITIGEKSFESKKDALAHYKSILNSYKHGELVSNEHFNELVDLIDYDDSFYEENVESFESEETFSDDEITNADVEQESEIVDIRVAKVRFNTKCFEIIYNDSSNCYISYIQIINRPKYDANRLFSIACRNAIQNDLITLKQKYFQNNSIGGEAKCQETGELCKWDALVVDHRQPNTFSMIVDRFKEIKQVNTSQIDYKMNDNNQLLFSDEDLSKEFVTYHKLKANLRIVRKENNLSRTGMARIKQTANDLKIE